MKEEEKNKTKEEKAKIKRINRIKIKPIIDRLKVLTKVKRDIDLAKLMNSDSAKFAQWKSRGHIPEEFILKLAKDNNYDLNFIYAINDFDTIDNINQYITKLKSGDIKKIKEIKNIENLDKQKLKEKQLVNQKLIDFAINNLDNPNLKITIEINSGIN